MPGTIANETHGESGFGYDPIFICDELGKTYAEMGQKEKNAHSHRGKALGSDSRHLLQMKLTVLSTVFLFYYQKVHY